MTRSKLAEIILGILEDHSGKCLDNGPERAVVCNDLVDVLALRLHLSEQEMPDAKKRTTRTRGQRG